MPLVPTTGLEQGSQGWKSGSGEGKPEGLCLWHEVYLHKIPPKEVRSKGVIICSLLATDGLA